MSLPVSVPVFSGHLEHIGRISRVFCLAASEKRESDRDTARLREAIRRPHRGLIPPVSDIYQLMSWADRGWGEGKISTTLHCVNHGQELGRRGNE
jgi:hypothetical protein